MQQYLDLLRDVYNNGTLKEDRTGTGTYSVFGRQIRIDLEDGFPLLTTKKIHIKSVLYELLWFIKGSTNIQYLNDNGISIWDAWADENGDLGRVYGKQWRSWTNNVELDPITGHDKHFKPIGIDQLQTVINEIKTNPYSRRLLVSAWNPADIPEMKLPPCHYSFQFNCRPISLYDIDWLYLKAGFNDGIMLHRQYDEYNIPRFKLDLMFNMRSTDIFLGLPFNIASYAFLLHMVASITNMIPGELVASFGDLHLYKNHMLQAVEQLKRIPSSSPKLILNKRDTIDDFIFEDFSIEGYNPQPNISAPIAV